MNSNLTFNPSAKVAISPRSSLWSALALSAVAHVAIAAGLMVEEAALRHVGTVREIEIAAAPAGMARSGADRYAAGMTRPQSAPDVAAPPLLADPPSVREIAAAGPSGRERSAISPVENANKPQEPADLRAATVPSGVLPKPMREPAKKPPADSPANVAHDAAGQAHNSDGSFVPPRYALGAAANPLPDYPRQARREYWEGRVVINVAVAPEGHAASVAVRHSSGHAILDQAALDAVRRWRFEPARRGGVPVAAAVDVPIRFRLEDHGELR